MPDQHSIEDTAVRYVLGELAPGEQRAFEAQLDQSATLRKWVQELESGVEAISLSAPPKRPPASIWQEIEKATIRKRRSDVARLLNWIPWSKRWQNGWAVATVCACGWLLYALWQSTTSPVAPSTSEFPQSAAQKNSLQVKVAPNTINPSVNGSNSLTSVLQARTKQIERLQQRTAELERQLARVSLVVAEQQVLLMESNRLRFFQFGPATVENGGPGSKSLSPRLQWALYMALARELGWQLPNSAPFTNTNEFSPQVNFVDLSPATNTAPATTSPLQSQTIPQTEIASAEPGVSPATASNLVAGFVSGSTAVVALDPGAAPPGSVFTFWIACDNGLYQSVGSSTLAANPTVVLMPNSVGLGTSFDALGNGSYLTITATSPNGVVTNFGQVYLPTIPPPP